MLVVGLTGSICSGKSTVAQMFKKRGAVVIDADAIAHELQEPGQPPYRAIVKAFGKEILKEDGRIDRSKLGSIIFTDPAKRGQLEAIMHPAIMRESEERIKQAEKEGAKICLVDAALLIEVGAYGRFQKVIVVAASEDIQLGRLLQRSHLDREEALRRIRAQKPLEEKVHYAHYTIDNSGSLEETERQVERIFKELVTEAEKKLDKPRRSLIILC